MERRLDAGGGGAGGGAAVPTEMPLQLLKAQLRALRIRAPHLMSVELECPLVEAPPESALAEACKFYIPSTRGNPKRRQPQARSCGLRDVAASHLGRSGGCTHEAGRPLRHVAVESAPVLAALGIGPAAQVQACDRCRKLLKDLQGREDGATNDNTDTERELRELRKLLQQERRRKSAHADMWRARRVRAWARVGTVSGGSTGTIPTPAWRRTIFRWPNFNPSKPIRRRRSARSGIFRRKSEA